MFPRFIPLLAVPALMLGACGTYNGGVESVYQPVVERQDYVFDVQTSGYGLAQGEPARLEGWMASMGVRYGDRIAIDDGGTGSGASVRREVAEEASRYGLTLADTAPVTVGQIAPGTVRVIVTRMTASVPGCPDYSRQYQPDYAQSTTSNYGCAMNSNLAAMVADPADLVRGVPGSPLADPTTGARAVNALRGARPSGGGGTTIRAESTGGSR